MPVCEIHKAVQVIFFHIMIPDFVMVADMPIMDRVFRQRLFLLPGMLRLCTGLRSSGACRAIHEVENGFVKLLAGCLCRRVFHSIGGYLYWIEYMPDNFPCSLSALYSILCNYSYIGPEALITTVILCLPSVRRSIEQVKRMALSQLRHATKA